MWIKPPRHAHAWVEVFAALALEARHAKLEPSLDKLDVRSLAQRVVDHRFVFIDRHGTCRIYEVATGLGVRLYAVDGAEDELFLEVGEEGEVAFGLSQ